MRMKNRKAISFFLLVLFSGIGIFFLAPTVHASFADTMGNIVGGFIGIIISALGVILALVIKVLVIVAQYSDFIDSAAVSNGWKIVRDLCNMFFVLVLLIIAFATILKIENYSYKKYLPKLILMAILINFSKTICGLLIDFAQVIMLTFVNAFKDVAGGNLISNLGITDVMTLAKNSKDVGFWAIISAYVLGLIYVLIALVVIVTMLAMLVMRIVMIWIYVVLSPAAYLFSAFPGGQKYASQWWDEFTKNLIVGPVLAFFIWLSFISLQGVDQVPGFASDTSTAAGLAGDMNIDSSSATDKNPDGTPFAASKASTPGVLIKFIIGIGMLIGGLKISQEIGGAAGSMAGKGMSAIQKGTVLAGKGAKGIAKWGGRQLGDVRDIASEKLGVDLNVVAGEKRRREQVAYNRELRKTKIRKATLEQAEEGKTWVGRKAALLSTGDVAWQNIVDGKFNAGSPKKSKQYLDKIKTEEDKKNTATGEMKRIDSESDRVVTKAENQDNLNIVRGLDRRNNKLEDDRNVITGSLDYKKLLNEEKYNSLTEDQAKDLTDKKEKIKKIDETITNNKKQKDTLTSKDIVVEDQAAKDAALVGYKAQKEPHSSAIVDADKEISKFTDVLRKNKLSEVQSARAEIDSKMEGEASKKISNFSNADQLVGIYKEAEEQHDAGLMAACYKKLAKTGNFNELHRELGLGTGYEGMVGMSKRLQDHGGMTEQDARGLVAEIGELAKSVNHFEAFGAMSMNKAGKWGETGADQQQAIVLAEKSKIQVQQFVRAANRLGNGSYQSGQPHDAEHWEISPSTIALFASKDSAYADEMKKTGNINTIQFIGGNEKNLDALEKNGAILTAKVIRDLCAKAKVSGSNVSNPLDTIKNII